MACSNGCFCPCDKSTNINRTELESGMVLVRHNALDMFDAVVVKGGTGVFFGRELLARAVYDWAALVGRMLRFGGGGGDHI